MPVSKNRRNRKKMTSSKRFTKKTAKRYIERFLPRFLMNRENENLAKSMAKAINTLKG